MKKSLKQIITLCLMGLLIFSGIRMMMPQKAYAILGLGDIVTDPGDIVENTISEVENGVTSVSTTYLQLKASVFDAIATAIAKQLLMQITLSVVKWINSGFKGSPSFVQNPSQFFESVGDQIAGNFLASNSDLAASLCSPFSINVRVALALDVAGPGTSATGNSPYSCSLSTMINNTTNAVKGASINGFTAGDFRQGGWPAFLALTTVPSNNPNGAYLQAQAALSAKTANQQAIKKTQLSQGNGFQSFTTCKADPNAKANANNPNNDNSGQVCTVQTPGNTISSALNKNLGIPQDNLLLANDMNAIINALFSQLIVQVLGNGLTSVSQPGPNGKSYLDQISDSASSQLQKLQNTIMSSLAPDIKNETTIAQNADTALAIATAAQTTLTSAEACYTAIAIATSSTPYPTAITYAQGQANQIQQILATSTVPISTISIANLTAADNEANANLQSFNSLTSTVSAAQDVNDLSSTSLEIQSLSESGNLPTAADALKSTDSLTTTESQIAPVQADANSRLSTCESFNPATYETDFLNSTGG